MRTEIFILFKNLRFLLAELLIVYLYWSAILPCCAYFESLFIYFFFFFLHFKSWKILRHYLFIVYLPFPFGGPYRSALSGLAGAIFK